jgi:HAMP domain-containing protein
VEEPAVANALYWLSWMSLLRNIAAALLVVGAALAFAEGWISEPWRKTVDDARTIEIARLSTSLETARAEIAAANAREKEAELKFRTPDIA